MSRTRKVLLLVSLIILVWFNTPAVAAEISSLFEQVSPSVVVIHAVEHSFSGETPGRMTTSQGQGSGFVISEDGLIMTAAHVVHVSNAVAVSFPDGSVIPVEIVGSAQKADVALLKLTEVPGNLAVAKLGDSDKTRVGDQIFVIGAPYGIHHTLTVGHISGRRKASGMSEQLIPIEFLQTDAAINHGNSGGPMFNMKGEVIGIVSSILSKSGGFDGIGFSASINNARELLLSQKPFWTGLDVALLSGDLARALNIPQEAGLLVQRVADPSPGYRLGLRPGKIPFEHDNQEFIIGGDIILSVQGETISKDIKKLRKIRKIISGHPDLTNVKITVLRGGRTLMLLRED